MGLISPKRAFCAGLFALALGVSSTASGAEALPWLTGVNLSDGALNSQKSRLFFDYTYPSAAEIDHFAGKGFKVFRVPLLSSRILPIGEGAKHSPDWGIVAGIIEHAKARGTWVILDLHQYGGMPSGLVGRDPAATAEFVAFWGEVAKRLKAEPNVIFGLMNEPNKQTAEEWLSGANAAIAAIRAAGANQLILVPGSYWDGASNWTRNDNARVMAAVVDPGRNFAYEVHQYLDKYSTGATKDVVQGTGATCLAAITGWARAHKAKLFLGEFGFAVTPEAMSEGEDLVDFMAQNKDVWRGWSYWAAGQWWGNYMFSVEPSKTGEDKPQMAVLEKHKE